MKITSFVYFLFAKIIFFNMTNTYAHKSTKIFDKSEERYQKVYSSYTVVS